MCGKSPKSNSGMISQEALDEFKAIWKKEFGHDIPDDIALDEATALLTEFNTVYRPIKKEWLDEYEKERVEQGKKS